MSTINLTFELPLTDADRAVLKALAETGLGELPPAPLRAGGHTPKPQSVEDVAAPKTKPAPKSKPKPEPAPAEPEPDKGEDGTSVEDAVARAATLLSEGKAGQVKAALSTLDISRVSQLKPSQVEAFLKELDS